MADRTPEASRLLASTHEEFSKVVASQVNEGSKLLTICRSRGAFKKVTGEHFAFSVRRGENGNVQNYDKDTTANRNAQTLTTRLHAYPKFVRVTETLPDTELDLNRGSATKIYDLYKEKANWASQDMAESINAQLYTDNSATATIFDGLETIITGTTGTYLGVNRANDTWWQSNEGDVSNDFSANGRQQMQLMSQDTSHSSTNKHPTVIITNKSTYNNYATTVFDKYSIESQEMKDLAFPSLMFDGAPIIWDTDCPANRMWFLRIGEGDMSPYKILTWNDNFVEPTEIEKYTEGVTFGFKCILQPLSCEPRSLGRVINCDTI